MLEPLKPQSPPVPDTQTIETTTNPPQTDTNPVLSETRPLETGTISPTTSGPQPS